MSKSWNLDPPLTLYSITLAANERRVVSHGRAAAFFLPIQGLNRDVPADSLRVSFGQSPSTIPVTEGIFISAPGEEGWNETVFVNTSGLALSFEYVLAHDPKVLIIHGV